MSNKYSRLLVVFVALLLLLGSTQCAAPTPQVVETVVEKIVEKEVLVQPDYVTLRTNWLYSGIHAWLFYGREKGYFREQGIELDIREGNGSGNVVRTVINKGDDFALVSIGNPIISITEGAPIKIIYTWIGAFNWGYICRPESGVKVPKDLEGKIIVSSPGNAGLNYHPLYVKMAGLDPDKMQPLTLVDAGAMVSTVLAGKADCELGGYADHLPLWAKEGMEAVVLRLEDAGTWGPSTAAITHQDLIDQNPDLVKRMVAALFKSQMECEKDPEACAGSLVTAYPSKDLTSELMALNLTLPDWFGPDQGCVGQIVQANWQAALDLIKSTPESAIKDDTRLVEEFYDAQFIPPCP
ncbi:MAG TPA: ABC transporter substrate-binding protein [Anaerolineae bacterium]|nr:ABC transporter substrate-binding protein [Anaerolineae bacterium]